MTAIRRRVRAVAFAWLLCQVASLSAFVPEACCIAHTAEAEAKATEAECHEAAAPQEPEDGAMCPMHHGRTSGDGCTIGTACDGPGTQLLRLFSYNSTIDEPFASPAVLESTLAFVAPAPPLLHRLALPDAPPPRH